MFIYGSGTNRKSGAGNSAGCRRSGTNVSLLVDSELISGTYPITAPLDFIKLSGTNNIEVDAQGFPVDSTQFDKEGLSLNGYIQGLKVFDKVLSNSEVALVI